MTDLPRLVSFMRDGRPGWGAVTGPVDGPVAGVADLSARHGGRWPDLSAVLAEGALAPVLDLAAAAAADLAAEEIAFLPPLPRPGKIICVGVNYPDRNAEYRDGQEAPPHPSLFVRFPESFTGHRRPLIRPRASRQLDYEGEIAVVIGRAGRHIPEQAAWQHVAALTLCNEGTLRDWVRHAKFNVTQGKNFDRSGAMGPWLVPFRDPAQIADVRLTTRVNGELRQDDRTGRMIFPVPRLLAYISTFTTLKPGDIIVTGTPAGAGARRDPPVWLKPGDVVAVSATGIGTLVNGVADEGGPEDRP
ncbi:MAG: 2-hydroxyhepta-2,4-diene-1,7-dioate isomerase [Paracoccaceae bacterium]|nr:MAG: 2-hydroxyhepta-2,4-diene-1,7-dioate isomerase [Paracoccaceae bacterium]